MPSKEDYADPIVAGISVEDQEKLFAEIGVTEMTLRRDAAALREWINAEPHLPNITCDFDKWLQTFLIVSKNSMEKAKGRLDNYFTNRNLLREWFVLPPPPQDTLLVDESRYVLTGYFPNLLPGGYVLMMEKIMMPKEDSWSMLNIDWHFQRALLQGEAILGQGKVIRGACLVMDLKNINMTVVSTFLGALGPFRKLISCLQDGLPLRVHSVHLINSPAANLQRMLLGAITPLLKDKLGERIFIHSNFESLHKHIPKDYLPKEYGGSHTATMEDMSRALNTFILNKKEWYESRAFLRANEEKRLIKKPSDYGTEGSFRKLEVD